MRGGLTRFTFDVAIDRRPLWSPDGTQIVYVSNPKKGVDLYSKPSNGAGTEQLLLETPYTKTPDDWSPDGRFVLYNENNGKNSDILALPLQGERKPVPVANSAFSENNGQCNRSARDSATGAHQDQRSRISAERITCKAMRTSIGEKFRNRHGL